MLSEGGTGSCVCASEVWDAQSSSWRSEKCCQQCKCALDSRRLWCQTLTPHGVLQLCDAHAIKKGCRKHSRVWFCKAHIDRKSRRAARYNCFLRVLAGGMQQMHSLNVLTLCEERRQPKCALHMTSMGNTAVSWCPYQASCLLRTICNNTTCAPIQKAGTW